MNKKGAIRTGGRVAGTPNKRTQEVVERLAELNCDPIEGMAKIAAESLAAARANPVGKGYGEMMTLAGRMYAELAQYVAPKRKAIEHSGEGGEPIKLEIVLNG